MKDERYWPVLGTWLKDTAKAPPDPQQTAREVAQRIPQTPQLRRRWWQPSLRRAPVPPPSNDHTADHQPVSTPATTDRLTTTGRTHLMLSPVKAITAGALVFALGGAFLIAQPFGQQGSSAPGAETGDAGAATWVTGDITPEWDCTGLTFEMVGTVRHERGQRCGPHKWTTSDPRLSGDVTEMWNADVYQMEDGFISNFAFAYFVTNEAGGWTCHSDAIAEGYGVSPDFVTGGTTTCVGDGGYDGLSATLVLDTWGEGSLVGLVFPGDGPPRPEPAAE